MLMLDVGACLAEAEVALYWKWLSEDLLKQESIEGSRPTVLVYISLVEFHVYTYRLIDAGINKDLTNILYPNGWQLHKASSLL